MTSFPSKMTSFPAPHGPELLLRRSLFTQGLLIRPVIKQFAQVTATTSCTSVDMSQILERLPRSSKLIIPHKCRCVSSASCQTAMYVLWSHVDQQAALGKYGCSIYVARHR